MVVIVAVAGVLFVVLATALWALDYMFTSAINGCQGVNFHGGGNTAIYTPILDNGTNVIQARPVFYGLKMFSMLPSIV